MQDISLYKSPLHQKSYGPDILHKVGDKALKDTVQFRSICQACDMGKILSGASHCLAISAVLGVVFEAELYAAEQKLVLCD
jgi:hypothetical protein